MARGWVNRLTAFDRAHESNLGSRKTSASYSRMPRRRALAPLLYLLYWIQPLDRSFLNCILKKKIHSMSSSNSRLSSCRPLPTSFASDQGACRLWAWMVAPSLMAIEFAWDVHGRMIVGFECFRILLNIACVSRICFSFIIVIHESMIIHSRSVVDRSQSWQFRPYIAYLKQKNKPKPVKVKREGS